MVIYQITNKGKMTVFRKIIIASFGTPSTLEMFFFSSYNIVIMPLRLFSLLLYQGTIKTEI